MVGKTILETERLILREFTSDDVDFILELLNSPSFLEFIGDKKVKSIDEAVNYLNGEPIGSYKENGFGLWNMVTKENNLSIGMCGLVKRDTLKDIDIGFALLPKFEKMGYGLEAAAATMNYAKNTLKIKPIVAITDLNNTASINLLYKLGLQFEKTLNLAEDDKVLLLSPPNTTQDQSKINQLTAKFFDLFTNKNRQDLSLHSLQDMFIPQGLIINNNSEAPVVYNVDSFITSRKEILTSGSLVGFSEREVFHVTKIYGSIGQRFSLYTKSGILNGEHFEAVGMKTIQFIKVNGIWKISSIAWKDED